MTRNVRSKLLGGGFRTAHHRLAASAGSLKMGSFLLSSSTHFVYELVAKQYTPPFPSRKKYFEMRESARELHRPCGGVALRPHRGPVLRGLDSQPKTRMLRRGECPQTALKAGLCRTWSHKGKARPSASPANPASIENAAMDTACTTAMRRRPSSR